MRGIIPAHAGFTGTHTSPGARGWDHPRSRGVYRARAAPSIGVSGSSPLTRGLRRCHPGYRGREGIIPAHAGFTSVRSAATTSGSDHPRSRGVYCAARDGILAPWGSSPLTRGLPRRLCCVTTAARIIPAHAGFTASAQGKTGLAGDHPRSRGVYLDLLRSGIEIAGSSPLTRGLRGHRWRHVLGRRIIPAHAGFTGVFPTHTRSIPDHPRSRGVYAQVNGIGHADPWIIPAHAGFTRQTGGTTPTRPDHPRSRGVYLSTNRSGMGREGSSPLTRGLHGLLHHCVGSRRIIPAHAGFTR